MSNNIDGNEVLMALRLLHTTSYFDKDGEMVLEGNEVLLALHNVHSSWCLIGTTRRPNTAIDR